MAGESVEESYIEWREGDDEEGTESSEARWSFSDSSTYYNEQRACFGLEDERDGVIDDFCVSYS